MKKKLLSTILSERIETIEFRKIRRDLMKFADNKKREYKILHIEPKTITMLENEGLTVTKTNEHGYETYRITF